MSAAVKPKRETTQLEEIGERCLIVCRDHANDKEPDVRLLADFLWALDIKMDIQFLEKP